MLVSEGAPKNPLEYLIENINLENALFFQLSFLSVFIFISQHIDGSVMLCLTINKYPHPPSIPLSDMFMYLPHKPLRKQLSSSINEQPT